MNMSVVDVFHTAGVKKISPKGKHPFIHLDFVNYLDQMYAP